jgi:hypothetical protein
MTRLTFGLDEHFHAYRLANQPPEHPLLAALRDETRTMPRARCRTH